MLSTYVTPETFGGPAGTVHAYANAPLVAEAWYDAAAAAQSPPLQHAYAPSLPQQPSRRSGGAALGGARNLHPYAAAPQQQQQQQRSMHIKAERSYPEIKSEDAASQSSVPPLQRPDGSLLDAAATSPSSIAAAAPSGSMLVSDGLRTNRPYQRKGEGFKEVDRAEAAKNKSQCMMFKQKACYLIDELP